MPINTVYQLIAEDDGAAIAGAERIALMPDLLVLWLTGELANELTVASTTGLLEAGANRWTIDLVARLGLPERLFDHDLIEPGQLVGRVLPTVHADAAGSAVGTPVYAVAGHDTACAFAAAPVTRANAAVLSSGTWSLVGVEVLAPCLGPDAAAFNLSNERGVGGGVRLLRNVMGLWLVQECQRAWSVVAGARHTDEDLHRLAQSAPPDVPLFDPDHPSLLRGGRMPSRMASLCGGSQPRAHGEVVRSILTSLACKYRLVVEQLEQVTGRDIEVVHVVGGGARNRLLCQLTADLLHVPVLAGPSEATALGNVLVQAKALGELGSVREMREIVLGSLPPVRYEPADGSWPDQTYERFLASTGLKSRQRERSVV
jgi:rhamnulokinase